MRKRISVLWFRISLLLMMICALCTGLFMINIAKVAHAASVAVSPHQTSLTANWDQFGYQHTRFNSLEKTLSPSNVSQIVPTWATYVGDAVNSSPAIVNGIIYIGSYDGSMKAFDVTTGKILWSHTLISPPPNALPQFIDHSSPAVANGLVYVGALSFGEVYAFDAKTGNVAWSYSPGGDIDDSPFYSNHMLYIGADNQQLYAFQASTGKLSWTFKTNGRFYQSSPIVANGIVYFTVDGGTLYAVNASTGKLLWNHPGYSPTTPVVDNGVVYAPIYEGMAALNGQTGKVLWSTSMNDRNALAESTPTIANGMVYVGTDNGKILAFDAQTGAIKWTYTNPLEAEAFDAAVRVGLTTANGVLYTSDDYGQFLAFNALTGKLLWLYESGQEAYCSPVVVNGSLYTGSNTGLLYKFSLP